MLVYTGDVIRAKPGTEPSVHMANYQTVGYKFRPLWSVGTEESDRVSVVRLCTHRKLNSSV